MAQELRAAGKPLPTEDSLGRTIPWDRVRRQEGRDAIPRVRQQSKELDTTTHTGNLCHETYQCNDSLENHVLSNTRMNQRLFHSPVTERTMSLSEQDEYSPISWTIDTPLSPTLDLSSLECMLHCCHDFFQWQVSSKKPPDSGLLKKSLLWDTYLDTFRKLKYCDSSKQAEMLFAAGGSVAPYLRQCNTGFLCEMLAVLYESVLCLDWPNIAVLVRLFRGSSIQELGPHHPLSVLLETMYKEASDPSYNSQDLFSPISRLSLVPLMKCAIQELSTCDAVVLDDLDAVFDAQEDLISLLQDDIGEGIHDPYEAEHYCLQLIQWCLDHFGDNDTRLLRAQGYLAWTYKLQGNEDRGYMILQDLWSIWQERSLIYGREALKSGVDWCPAWKIARMCQDRKNWHGYRIYGYEAFSWSLLKRGDTNGETLRLLDRHIDLLEQLNELERIDWIRQSYSTSCNLLKRFQAI